MFEDLYEKFPTIVLEGKALVWDLRQDLSQVPPQCRRVYVKSFLDESTKEQLLNIPAAERVTDGLPEMTLGYDCARAEGHPSQKINVVAVTGTNGKSTTVALLGQLFSRSSSMPVVVLGTLGLQVFEAGVCTECLDTGFTTPDAPALQRLLNHCVRRGWRYFIMEASSQGWSYGRLAGCEFSALGFTNLTQDHLDYHGSMQAYSEAKQSLFVHGLKGAGVLQASDTIAGRDFIDGVLRRSGTNDIRVIDYRNDFLQRRSSLDGHDFSFVGERYHLPLVGDFNLENLRVALELFRSQFGVYPAPQQIAALTPAKGRLELAGAGERPYVYVDYAHTPDALEKSLLALRHLKTPEQKLWVVFGCGGDRDAAKRPLMGAIAERLADEVVITSDNPRTEEPLDILRQIEGGLKRPARLAELDRRQAIRWSLEHMAPADVLLIAGKGHEEYQILGTQKLPFSDFNEVLSVLNQNFTT